VKKFQLLAARYFGDLWAGWDRFWFTPSDPATICLMRIFAGLMLLYTHLIWSLRLTQLFGSGGWIPVAHANLANNESPFALSYLNWIGDDRLLWAAHLLALLVLLLFTVGLWTRVTSILAAVIAISYCNRATGLLFGLDQINILLVLYLALAPCGDCFSVDALFRWGRGVSGQPTVMTNIATRLIQIHMCIVYLFAGTGKLLGESWWNGEAIWMSAANYEYQSLDLTWLVHYPLLVNFLTHLTIAFELSYIALIWPRLTRPIILLTALALHLGIAMGMGMITFGLIMIIANFAFVPPGIVRTIVQRVADRGGSTRTETV
jgi:hypothetical protein